MKIQRTLKTKIIKQEKVGKLTQSDIMAHKAREFKTMQYFILT